MRHIYLHGFASSPRSRKAVAFRTALGTRNIPVEIPDLAGSDFAHLTITGQLAIIEKTLQGEPCRLIGSSMGGYLAALYASTHREVDRLVLLAPAFGFQTRWREMQGPETMAQWRDTGWMEVFHYGDMVMRRLHYGLYEDAGKFPDSPDFHQPALIFHGVNDTVVPVDLSRTFAASHPNARLLELESDHELLDVLSVITDQSTLFLAEPLNSVE